LLEFFVFFCSFPVRCFVVEVGVLCELGLFYFVFFFSVCVSSFPSADCLFFGFQLSTTSFSDGSGAGCVGDVVFRCVSSQILRFCVVFGQFKWCGGGGWRL
jgi:hypothetical protein